jgi:tetratricopeptide (TPR) repeat protein
LLLPPKKSKYQRIKGILYIHKRAYELSKNHFVKSADLDPENSQAWMGLGIAHENIGLYALAETYYHKALEDENACVVGNHNLGLLYGKWGKIDLSIKAYTKVSAADTDNGETYVNRGTAQFNLNNYKDALADFNKAIEIDPANKNAYNNRGLVLYSLGQYLAAIKYFKKALNIKLDPSFDENFDTHIFA